MKAFIFEKALAREENGDFIPAKDLIWIPVINWNPLAFVFRDYDEANIARIEMQKKDNNFYYRIAK